MAELREKRVELILQQLEALPALPVDAAQIEPQPLATAVFQTFNALGKKPDSALNLDEFWKHSLAVACCAELLAEQLVETWGKEAGLTPAEAFACGLMHDLGKVALDTALPK